MGKIEDALRSEILRLSRKATKETLVSILKNVRELKRSVSQLSGAVAALERKAARLEKSAGEKKARLDAPEEEVKGSRFSPALIRKLRKRLKITQGELALLTGVSLNAVATWEGGRSAPRSQNKAALVALRKLGRRDVKNLLAGKEKAGPKKKKKPAAKKARKRRRRKK